MRLETLEINGFKSFSDRSELAFDKGVTAIVGPNGCGKSNVSDAITWVMGEQSAKSLRGDKMEDVIFNGSDARKPSATAEVRLKFSGVVKSVSAPVFNPSSPLRQAQAGADSGGGAAVAVAEVEGGVATAELTDTADAVGHRITFAPEEAEELIQTVAREVEVTYVRGGKAFSVRGRACVLACYNAIVPYLCPQLPAAQKEALARLREDVQALLETARKRGPVDTSELERLQAELADAKQLSAAFRLQMEQDRAAFDLEVAAVRGENAQLREMNERAISEQGRAATALEQLNTKFRTSEFELDKERKPIAVESLLLFGDQGLVRLPLLQLTSVRPVDPAVQLWNRTFLDNLRYGNSADLGRPLPEVIDQAELRQLPRRVDLRPASTSRRTGPAASPGSPSRTMISG